MAVKAKINYLKIAPRKVRLVADLIRGKSVEEAQVILKFLEKRSSLPMLKLLNQASVSALNNFQLNAQNLYISKITVDEGPKLKRWRPRARGQAYRIQKKTSHITIILDEIADKSALKKKTKKIIKEKNKSVDSFSVKKDKSEVKLKKTADDKEKEFSFAKEKKNKLRPGLGFQKPKTEKSGIKRIFRRKSF